MAGTLPVCLLLYPQLLEQSLANGGCSVFVEWMKIFKCNNIILKSMHKRILVQKTWKLLFLSSFLPFPPSVSNRSLVIFAFVIFCCCCWFLNYFSFSFLSSSGGDVRWDRIAQSLQSAICCRIIYDIPYAPN